jgi:hypothetical protein
MLISWITLAALLSLVLAIHKYILGFIFIDVYDEATSHSSTLD